MKIVTWNCNGAFRKKYSSLYQFDADILVIQECENPLESTNNEYIKWASNYLWIGEKKSKGIGVFAKQNIDLKLLDFSPFYENHEVKLFLPFSANKQQFLAVWTKKNNSPNFGYIGQLWKYLQINKSLLKDTIILGDFNSNTIWDQRDRWWNHSDVVNILSSLNLVSLYHFINQEEQGNESLKTFYLYRKKEKGYHIDFVFLPEIYLNKVTNFEVGTYDKWIEFSDHTPLFFSIS